MGKKKVSFLGSENEDALKAKKATQREQKKMREGKVVAPVAEITPVSETVTEKPIKKVRVRSKAYLAAKKQVDVNKNYSLEDALKLLHSISISKTNDTVELHINVKEPGLSREVTLPHPTGKTKSIAVANDETIAQIESGKTNFDVLLASPTQMAKLVKFAKILGPRGLMPNPKNGTVVTDPEAKAKIMANSNVVTLKTEKDTPVIHTIAGKLSMKDELLTSNINAILTALSGKITKIVLKSTMSPAIKLVVA
ncbi:MAG: 50S ribosomal protein L1 [Candidatus Amesbacteria bacterium GW2011_GWA2_42_12]|uniref:Large ribosomal subunit protein uL1 n=1 Tax=Candidatus Amesbacteria bacterium GW2011_GWA2_42_12 TaxID=1618356 RepID=A0A0G0Y6A6_9BACT|nr:MAG: 50S ribosomal protein L1 [Candidatus Amesbacteria bacterium GW2011_GWA2_42_12]